jgi:uncharacterized SAM-binding protein YcdF (DUF218 family)
MGKRKRRGCLLLVLLAVLVAGAAYLARAPLLRRAASFLVVSEEPAPADLAVVHAGDRNRLAWAVELYNRKLARRLLVFVDPRVEGGFYGLTGEEAMRLARQAAEERGVAPEDIVFVRSVTSTWEEGIQTLRYLEQHPEVESVLLVSNPFHMRRVRAVHRDLHREGGPRLLCVPVPWDRTQLSLDRWWTRERELVWVQSEYVKLLFYHVRHFHRDAPVGGEPAAEEGG